MAERLAATDVAIVGGGIIGCSLAWYLAREGVDVVLIDRRDVNREASGTNAGSLHFQIWMPSEDGEAWIERMRPQLVLQREAARLWPTLEAELEADLGFRFGGGLMVGDSDADRALLERKVAAENAAGVPTRVVVDEELRTLAPFLSDEIVAASYHPEEGHANSLLVAPAFLRAAIRAGARLLTRTEVVAIERRPAGGFDVTTSRGVRWASRVVSAAGAWSSEIGAMVGVPIGTAGFTAIVSATEAAPPVMHGMLVQHVSRGLTLKQAPPGNFIIGGGWRGTIDETSGRRIPTYESLTANVAVAARTVPVVGRLRLLRTWAGTGVDSEDGMPVVGECERVPGFYVAEAGFGFTLGPLVARLLAERLLGRETGVPIEPFSPDRFVAVA
jgi:glycine/D-amino acid oxidase-like deaminating enzyme